MGDGSNRGRTLYCTTTVPAVLNAVRKLESVMLKLGLRLTTSKVRASDDVPAEPVTPAGKPAVVTPVAEQSWLALRCPKPPGTRLKTKASASAALILAAA